MMIKFSNVATGGIQSHPLWRIADVSACPHGRHKSRVEERQLKSLDNPSLAVSCDTQFTDRARVVSSNGRVAAAKLLDSDSHWNQHAGVKPFTCGSPAEAMDSADSLRSGATWQRCRRAPLRRPLHSKMRRLEGGFCERLYRQHSTQASKRRSWYRAIDPLQPLPRLALRDSIYCAAVECQLVGIRWRRSRWAQNRLMDPFDIDRDIEFLSGGSAAICLSEEPIRPVRRSHYSAGAGGAPNSPGKSRARQPWNDSPSRSR